MDERYLSFTTFLKQRTAQITKFAQFLTSNTSKRTHQSLPKSIRRRAMSHNRYRIPLKMRKPLQSQLIKAESMQKLPKCRKSIRKKHRLIVSYKARSGKTSWLRTHLWAAKRMRMGVYAGYKIAQSPNNKSFRSAYRHFRHNCCLMDYSYLQCLTISNNSHQSILPSSIKIHSSAETLPFAFSPYKFYHGDLINSNNNKLICPLTIFAQTSYKIRCLFDPFAIEQVNSMSWNREMYTVEIGKGKCQIYLLLGPEGIERVKEGLEKMGIGSQEIDGNCLKTSYEENSIIYIGSNNSEKQQEIITKAKPFISQSIPQKIVQIYDPQQNKKYRQMFYQSLIKSKKSSTQNKQMPNNYSKSAHFWQFCINLSQQMQKQSEISKQHIMKITSRSKYTHKRKNKLSKQQKKIVLQESSQKKEKLINNTEAKIQKKQQQNQQQIKQQKSQQIIAQETISLFTNKQKLQTTTKSINKTDPIIIAPFKQFNSLNQSYQGCLVMCSSRDNCLLWNALSKTNVKVIGRKQWGHLLAESGKRLFPRDYPESCCFQRWNKQIAMEMIDRHRKLPPQKRPNYQNLLSPSPFYFQVQSRLSTIKIRMIGRGRCFPGSYLYKLAGQDYQKIQQQIQNYGTTKSILTQQPPSTDQQINPINYNTSTYEQIVQELSILNKRTKRELIGMVTYGGFMMGTGAEGGIGYICRMEGNENNSEETTNGGYVLVRKATSRQYFLAQICGKNG